MLNNAATPSCPSFSILSARLLEMRRRRVGGDEKGTFRKSIRGRWNGRSMVSRAIIMTSMLKRWSRTSRHPRSVLAGLASVRALQASPLF